MGAYFPFNYQAINIGAGTYSPSPVKAYNNASFGYWCRCLFQRMTSTLKFDLPAEWQGPTRDFFIWCLFYFGYVAIFETPERGFTFQPAALSGYDWYYQPTKAMISNPAADGSLELEISKTCEILKLTPDYFGTFDVVEHYARMLSELDNSLNMSLINSKFAFAWMAKNKTAGQALKVIMDRISMGEPAVVTDLKVVNDAQDKDLPFQLLDRGNMKESYITTDLLMDLQTIINNFDSEIGIPSVPYYKKERLVSDEATSRNLDAQARVIVWYNTLMSSLEDVRKLYPRAEEIKIELRYNLQDDEDGEEADNGTL